MRIEEAIEIMNRPFNMKHTPKEILEAHRMAIEALEQEPCEDLISRQAALNAMYALCDTGETLKENPWRDNPHIDAITDALDTLRPVTPKEKTGKWIDEADEIDAQFGRHTYKCSECGKYAEYFISGTEVWWDRIKPNFCPNCGAKMIEPQESAKIDCSKTKCENCTNHNYCDFEPQESEDKE